MSPRLSTQSTFLRPLILLVVQNFPASVIRICCAIVFIFMSLDWWNPEWFEASKGWVFKLNSWLWWFHRTLRRDGPSVVGEGVGAGCDTELVKRSHPMAFLCFQMHFERIQYCFVKFTLWLQIAEPSTNWEQLHSNVVTREQFDSPLLIDVPHDARMGIRIDIITFSLLNCTYSCLALLFSSR